MQCNFNKHLFCYFYINFIIILTLYVLFGVFKICVYCLSFSYIDLKQCLLIGKLHCRNDFLEHVRSGGKILLIRLISVSSGNQDICCVRKINNKIVGSKTKEILAHRNAGHYNDAGAPTYVRI